MQAATCTAKQSHGEPLVMPDQRSGGYCSTHLHASRALCDTVSQDTLTARSSYVPKRVMQKCNAFFDQEDQFIILEPIQLIRRRLK